MNSDYYNWEEIFKNKTSKELYDIYIGKAHLPKEAINKAKAELENRNFDFKNIEIIQKGWRLASLLEEQNYRKHEVFYKKYHHISFKECILINVVNIAFCFLYFYLNDYSYGNLLILLIILIPTVTLGTILNNYYDVKRQKNNEERLENEINELKAYLHEKGMLNGSNALTNDIILEQRKQSKFILKIKRFTIIPFLIVLAILIYKLLL